MHSWRFSTLLEACSLALALVLGSGCSGTGDDDDDGTPSGDDDTSPGDDDSSDDLSVSIRDLQDETSDQHPGLDDPVQVKGVIVTTPMTLFDSGDPSGFWVSEPEGGAYAGIYVFVGGLEFQVEQGDELDILGVYTEYYGSSQIAASQITLVSQGQPVPDPAVVTTDDVATGGTDPEAHEGVLIAIENATITSEDLGYSDFGITSDGGSLELIVDNVFDDYYEYAPTDGFQFSRVMGVLTYSFDAYRLAPRGCEDLIDADGQPACERLPCPEGPIEIAQIQNPDDSAYAGKGCEVTVAQVIVTSPVTSTDDQPTFYVSEPEGAAWNGVMVFAEDLDTTGIEPGTELTITGTHDEYFGLTQIVARVLEITGTGELPEPEVLKPADINTTGAMSEMYEGTLVKVENVVITEAEFLGSDNEDHGDFVVARADAPDDTLVIGWQFEYSFACPSDESGTPCETDQREVGGELESITGLLSYSWDHFRLQPRTDEDLAITASDP